MAEYPTTGETCNHAGCPYPTWTGDPKGLCLYHSPENGKDEEIACKVWEGAHASMQRGFPGAVFIGWHFPDCINRREFQGVTFSNGANFTDATFGCSVHFSDATFGKIGALFNGVTFEDNADFIRATFQGNAWFKGATFRGDAEFKGATFRGDAEFKRATFQGKAGFDGAKFEAGVNVEINTPSPWSWLWGRRPFRRAEQGETAYRLAKEAARARGDYRRAGQYHYAEQCASEYGNRKRWGWKPWRGGFWRSFFEWPFAHLLFGYGEKPLRPLIAGLVVILLWSFFYWCFGGIGPGAPMLLTHDPTWFECLHFSVVTFTTLGYGDFQPKPDCRLMADAEAVLGAALMALFIVGLTRKYMR